MVSRVEQLESMLRTRREQVREIETEIRDARLALGLVDPDVVEQASGRRASPYPESIKTMVLVVLRESDAPMRSAEVRTAIARKFSVDVVLTTLSPQLGRLTASGEVEVEDGEYKIPQEENVE